jgi:hypothetical protein
MASPQRAVAEAVKLLVHMGWISAADAAEANTRGQQDFSTLPLPLISFVREEPVLEPELAGAPKQLRRKFLDPTTGKWLFCDWPGMYRTDYRITFWSKKRYSAVHFREWVYSQLGKVGKLDNETFIPVEHESPWGTIEESLKFTGSNDLSNLEGTDQRYIRVEFTFSLRTRMMRAKPPNGGEDLKDSADMIERIGWDVCEPEVGFGDFNEDASLVGSRSTDFQSGNLFYFYFVDSMIPSQWPKEGNAKVERGIIEPGGNAKTVKPNTLKMQLTGSTDAVELAERLTLLDLSGNVLFGLSFDYVADGQTELEILQRDLDLDPNVISSVFSLVLPSSRRWSKVHRFFVGNQDTIIANIRGIIGEPLHTINLHNIDLRHISTLDKILPSATIDLGTEDKHEWTGLEKEPYLIVLTLTATNGGVNIVTAEDDTATPAFTSQQSVDSAVNVGAVFLMQPQRDSLALRVPKTTTVASVYIQRYHGSYNGNEV